MMHMGLMRVAFHITIQFACKQQLAAGRQTSTAQGVGGERWHQKQSSIIILFTGKRASEWPNLLAVPDLYEIYKA